MISWRSKAGRDTKGGGVITPSTHGRTPPVMCMQSRNVPDNVSITNNKEFCAKNCFHFSCFFSKKVPILGFFFPRPRTGHYQERVIGKNGSLARTGHLYPSIGKNGTFAPPPSLGKNGLLVKNVSLLKNRSLFVKKTSFPTFRGHRGH